MTIPNINDVWDALLARPDQRLSQHLKNVSSLAAKFGKKSGMEEMARVIGFFHDLGKISDEFQAILDPKIPRGSVKVPHSIFGAKRIFTDLVNIQYITEILANAITAHHGALYDNVSPNGDAPLLSKLADTELFPAIADSPQLSPDKLNAEFLSILEKVKDKNKGFAISMLTKLLYSCLVDADRLDAYLHENNEVYKTHTMDWEELSTNLLNYLAKVSSETEISIFRQNISNECGKSGLRSRGIYKLEVPTGGGKTFASLRFALVHAHKHKLDRIIYVIPYLSILDQTADEIRKALACDETDVLEHHSSFLPDKPKYYKLQTDRWDAPIILTTQVQFLESVFSSRGSDLRKLHNMANSVIIFDEAQSLPVKCVHLFNGAINFLNQVCGTTILLCTATQPLLDKVERKLEFSQNPSIANCGTLSKRTNIVNAIKPGGFTILELKEFVHEKHKLSTLVIVNTKVVAKELFSELKDANTTVLHLSTNMCGAHRDDVIIELRRKLENKEPVICISTQLIEAGVDISFECVIRDVAGLDSIFQAAGRCNRHGEFGETKDVFVVNIAGENLSKLPDISKGAEITQWLFDEGRDNDINEYYQRYFYARKDVMDYPTRDGGTIYDLLSMNLQGCGAFRNRNNKEEAPKMRSAPKSASDEFFVIDKGRKDVIVNYGKAFELVERYSKTSDIAEKRKFLRLLGKYSVSLYNYQIEALKSAGALHEMEGEGITRLEKGSDEAPFYDLERGVDLNGQLKFLFL